MANALGFTGEISVDQWLISAFRAERAPRRVRRARQAARNQIIEPLRPAGVGLIYWISLATTVTAWLLR